MPRFQRSGISFEYPSDWTIDADDLLTDWTVTVESPITAFVLLALRALDESPTDIVDESLEALKEVYPDLEAELTIDTIGGQPAVGYDVDFLTLDVITVAWIRCVDTVAGPLLILAQSSEPERDSHEPDIDSILESIAFDDEPA